jgi:regulator of protease activity HflC (stomatin/prohibitin superfamily)
MKKLLLMLSLLSPYIHAMSMDEFFGSNTEGLRQRKPQKQQESRPTHQTNQKIEAPSADSSCCCCYILNPGITALHMRLGKIIRVIKEGGLYCRMPLIDSMIEMPNGIQKASIETSALSKDLQSISIGIDVNYRYTQEEDLYKATRGKAEEIVLIPFCHESIKAMIARYTAEELIQDRHAAKENIYSDLKERLRPHFIEFVEVNFSHADFSEEFIKSVESKQIAMQEAMKAKNLTEKIKETAAQTRLIAEADAHAQQVKKESVTKELVQLKAIEKWDGVLPRVVSGAIPFLDLNKEQTKE